MRMHQFSQTHRVMTSKHTGIPRLEVLNTHYGYWATDRYLDEEEHEQYRKRPEYTGPLHEAEVRWNESCRRSCG